MACFRSGFASRTDEDDEENQNHVPHLDHDGLHQMGTGGKSKRWSHCRRMVWSLTVLLFSGGNPTSPNAKRRGRLGLKGRKMRVRGEETENNRLWLLGGTHLEEEEEEEGKGNGKVVVEDQQSMRPSFRFSFGSQVEEADGALVVGTRSPAVSATTVLLLSLEKEEEEEEEEEEDVGESVSSSSEARERRLLLLKCRRLESLERSISSVAAAAAALVRFSYQEIRTASGGFCEGRVLGRGALSCVYRGRMRRGLGGRRTRVVAIKRLRGTGERESTKQFCRELMVAGSLRNQNVVPILGFCIDREGLFLVYKYVPGGSLDRHLHPEKNGDASDKYGELSWGVRFKVALGTARAVEYLHCGTDRCIVHRDIKPSNILLTSNKNPKLCDFGLATWTHRPSLPFLCKNVKGTFGYLAPEYFQHGKLSDKTDVYAFGVVLLELITGRKPIDTTRPHGDENLVLWAKPLLQQGGASMKDLVDPRLRSSSYNQNEMCQTIRAAAACLNSDESGRPRITEVISMLSGEKANCNKWPVLTGNGCFAGYDTQMQDQPQKSDDMSGHLALAMLGVSDTDEDDVYDR